MYQDKDQRTCFLNKLYSEDNPYSVHILDDNLRMDHPDILIDMYKFHCHNVHWDHKAMVYRGQQQWVQLRKEQTCYILGTFQ